MPNILPVYLQACGFPSQRSEYAFECSLGDMAFPYRTPLLMLVLLRSLCRWTVIELLV